MLDSNASLAEDALRQGRAKGARLNNSQLGRQPIVLRATLANASIFVSDQRCHIREQRLPPTLCSMPTLHLPAWLGDDLLHCEGRCLRLLGCIANVSRLGFLAADVAAPQRES